MKSKPWVIASLLLWSASFGCGSDVPAYDDDELTSMPERNEDLVDGGAEMATSDASPPVGFVPSCKVDPVGLELDVSDSNDGDAWALVAWKNTLGVALRSSGCKSTDAEEGYAYLDAWAFPSTGDIPAPSRHPLGTTRCSASRSVALVPEAGQARAFVSSTHDGPDELYSAMLKEEVRPERMTFDPDVRPESELLTHPVAWDGESMLAFVNHREGMGDQIVTRLGNAQEIEVVPFQSGAEIKDLTIAKLTGNRTVGGVIGWIAKQPTGQEIKAQLLDPQGKPLDEPRVLSNRVGPQSRIRVEMLPTVSASTPAGAIVYQVSGDQEHGELRFRTILLDGEIGQEQGVVTGGLNVRGFAMAPFASGYALVYRVATGGRGLMHVRMIDFNGATASYGQLLLTEASPVGSAPRMVATNDGRLTVAFTDVTQQGTKLRVLRATCDPK